MADITLTSSIRSNLLSLQNTSKLLDLTSTRLSTGKKVNSALDNPGSFFTARGLSNRATDLTKLKDGINQAIQTLKTADKGITSITNLVEQAKSIAEQAKEAVASGTVTESVITLSAAATGGQTLTALGIIGDDLTFAVSGAGTVTVTGGQTLDAVAAAVTALDSAVTLAVDEDNDTFTLSATAGTTVNVTGATAGVTAFGANATSGTDIIFGTAGTASVSSLQDDYNKVLQSITDLVGNGDTSYKGINLLKSTNLTVNLSENDSSLTISGVDGTLTGLGLADATWTAGSSIDADITLVEGAVTNLRNFSSSFGTDLSILQYRETYTTELVNTLKDGAGQLVNASLEEEAANLLALQTRQSLGTQSLSIANQSQQSILSLFR